MNALKKLSELVSDYGEIRLLTEVVLPHVTTAAGDLGDDCVRVDSASAKWLWSIDPCPTPVAHWLNMSTPEVLGWYTATINLSDIAACGGLPVGMLVSLELSDDTRVDFIESFYEGLTSALTKHKASLLGGNLKVSPRFSATGTILGREGRRRITRQTSADNCDVFLVGQCGMFWASAVAHLYGRLADLHEHEKEALIRALLFPEAHVVAGQLLAEMPFAVACMDCSDGPANALYQLAGANKLDIVIPDDPAWAIPDFAKNILASSQISKENACFLFGDWQLACLVPHEDADYFAKTMSPTVPLTWLGCATRGRGDVSTRTGRRLSPQSINENFRNGYNSISSAQELVERYLQSPVFI